MAYNFASESPADRAFAITPSDATIFDNPTRGIYVGGAGNIALRTRGGDTVTLMGCVAGSVIPVQADKVLAVGSGTTATNLVGLW